MTYAKMSIHRLLPRKGKLVMQFLHHYLERSSYVAWVRLVACAGVAFLLIASSTAYASGPQSSISQPVPNTEDLPMDSSPANTVSPEEMESASKLYLPMVSNNQPIAWRLGYANVSGSLDAYQELASLRAGWYLNWVTNMSPVRPNGMEYAQMVRVRQKLTCEVGTANSHNRDICPYAVPHTYTTSPNSVRIQQVAAANPGSLWLLGNEIDRRDWPGGNQDEILPEVYAEAYHDLYTLIKGADPQAKVAIGGVVQTTPLRLEYLSKVWDAYQSKYGTPMPVDVWNMHVFVLPEKRNSWGADIPVGSNATSGEYIFHPDAGGNPTTPMPEHIELKYVDEQVKAMRTWMKARGQQEKPLIVTEYGVLLFNHMLGIPNDDPQTIVDYMLGTFDYFLNTQDCSLGYGADECRLVQRWLWYSLDGGNNFNTHASLYNKDTKTMNPSGAAFRDWARTNMTALSKHPSP
jgi:hypothetical protein